MKDKKTEHKQTYPVIDERQGKAVGQVSTIIVVFTVIYLLIEATYKYITTQDILMATWEIILLVLIGSIFLLGIRSNKEMNLPTSFLGKSLPTEESKKARNIRLKSYLIESITSSAVITGISLFFTFIEVEEPLSVPEYSVGFIGFIAIYFIMSYIFGEYSIKKYNKYMANLDD